MQAPDRAPNRALILEDARYWLGTITEANGYPLTVATVGEELLTAEEVGEDLPYLAVCPAATSPPPRYEYGGHREVFFDFVVIGHVRADSPTEREVIIAELEQAAHDALHKDPRRDGWAVDTLQIAGASSDEGVPARESRGGMVASFSATYRCNFHPQDETEVEMAHGELYQTAAIATPLTPGTFVPVNGTVELGDVRDFDEPANGRLRYTGIRARDFIVEAVGSALGNTAFDAILRLRINGVSVAKSQVRCAVDTAGRQPFAVRAILTLQPNDYVDLAVDGTGATATIEDLNLTALQVPKF